MPMHQVEVNVQNYGDLTGFSNLSHGFEHVHRRRAGGKPALSSQLVDQAVRQRITERHPELEHVYAKFVEGQGQLPCGVEIRVTGSDVRDETFPSIAPEP